MLRVRIREESGQQLSCVHCGQHSDQVAELLDADGAARETSVVCTTCSGRHRAMTPTVTTGNQPQPQQD